MAQRDYVSRGQSSVTRRKKNRSRKKQHRLLSVSPTMVAIAAAAVVAFVGFLYFITHHKKEEIDTLPGHKVIGNSLPPKPEERWRYIKELENRQPSVRTPTEPTAGGDVMNPNQLTPEQRQLLEQMQSDMRQQPTQLNEVPWNEPAPTQHPQTSQPRVPVVQQPQPRQSHLTTSAAAGNVTTPDPLTQEQQQLLEQMRADMRQPSSQDNTAPHNVQAPAQRQPTQQRQRSIVQPVQPRGTEQPAPVSREQAPASQTQKEEKSWMIQCGSFKNSEQAETIRAQLAFEGFSFHITTHSGWNRVVMGPIQGKNNADGILIRLKRYGHTNCIRLAAGG